MTTIAQKNINEYIVKTMKDLNSDCIYDRIDHCMDDCMYKYIKNQFLLYRNKIYIITKIICKL